MDEFSELNEAEYIKNDENMDDVDEYSDHKLKKRRKKQKNEFLQWMKAILIALVVAYLLKSFVFERALVEGSSMNNTLANMQTLVEFKLGVLFAQPNRGDIVVFEHIPGQYNRYLPLIDDAEVDYIKRVIALPGETIDIKNGFVYITNKEGTFKLIESYTTAKTERNVGALSLKYPYKVQNDELFVMGDNRDNSSDSRVFGAIKLSSVRGVAIFRLTPLKVAGLLNNTGKPLLIAQSNSQE